MFRSFSLVAHGVRRCRVVAKAERGPRNTRPSHVFDLSVSRYTRYILLHLQNPPPSPKVEGRTAPPAVATLRRARVHAEVVGYLGDGGAIRGHRLHLWQGPASVDPSRVATARVGPRVG